MRLALLILISGIGLVSIKVVKRVEVFRTADGPFFLNGEHLTERCTNENCN